MGVNNSMLRCVNDAGDRESDLISMRNLRVRNKDKRELQFGNRVVYLSPMIESGDGSSSYFSPVAMAGTSKEERNYATVLPSQTSRRLLNPSRNTEMSMQRLKKLSTMIKLGNIEGLDYLVTKWQWQYDDIKFENLITPLILAVMSNQLPMVQFLVSQGVDMDHLDLVGRSAIDWSISCNYETIYYYLKSSVKKTASSTASSTSSQSFQSLKIRDVEEVTQSKSFKSTGKSAGNQRVVAFYDESPEVRNPHRAISRDYAEEASVDDERFVKEIPSSHPGRQLDALKMSDHVSPLTQSSGGNAYASVKKAHNTMSPLARSSRSKQSRPWSSGDSKSRVEAVKGADNFNVITDVESNLKKDPSPDSVRKWMTKRIVAAAEAVIPNIESNNPPANKPRFTRSIRKASSKAVRYFWKKKFEPKALES